MHAVYTVPLMLLFGIFLAGYFLGWIMATARSRSILGSKSGDISVDAVRAFEAQLGNKTTSKMFRLKCKCGAVWNFRSGDTPGASEVPVLPDGDSYTCPTCGFAINLKPVREMLGNR